MTAFRMIDSESPLVKEIIQNMDRYHAMGSSILSKENVIMVSQLSYK